MDDLWRLGREISLIASPTNFSRTSQGLEEEEDLSLPGRSCNPLLPSQAIQFTDKKNLPQKYQIQADSI
jgi:hypothetical protein